MAATISLDDKVTKLNLPDSGFLATLDAGERYVVTIFEVQWWSGRKPRDLTTVEVLNASNLEKCIEHYREQKLIPGCVIPVGSGAGRSSTIDAGAGTKPAIAFDTSAAEGKTRDTSMAGISPETISTVSDEDAGCRSCHKYRQVLSDVLEDVVKFQNFASVMSTSSENLFNLGIRRASIFNSLHEAAILKESDSIPPPVSAPAIHHIKSVFQNATSELNRLKDLPASSYKWTWGETLTRDDVLNLRRSGTHPGRVPHNGYDVSLLVGRLDGEFSAGPSTLLSDTCDDLPAIASSISTPPSTDLHFPQLFSHPDHNAIYNPYKSNATINLKVPVPSPGTGTGTGTISALLAMADDWDGQAPASAPASNDEAVPTDDVLHLLDVWENVVQNEEENVDEAAPTDDVLHLLDVWENDVQNEEENVNACPMVDSSDLNTDELLAMAESWDDNAQLNSTTAMAPAPALAEIVAPIDIDQDSAVMDDILRIADSWNDEDFDPEHSGDELISPSYTPGPLSPALDPAHLGVERQFGPEDFSFLRDEMFEYD